MVNDELLINDELLTLYFYRDELSDKQLAAIELALEQDPSLAEQYAELCNKLDALGTNNNTQAPPQAMQRWHAALNQAAAQEAKTPVQANSARPSGSSWFAQLFQFNVPTAAAAVLLLGLGIVIGINLSNTHQGIDPESPLASSNDQSFARGVNAYLQEAEMQLASLQTGDADQRRVLMNEIISRNRLYIRAAENSNAPELARVLRAFGPVLDSLADSQTTDQKFELAKAQLAFELGAMQTKLTHDASKQTTRL